MPNPNSPQPPHPLATLFGGKGRARPPLRERWRTARRGPSTLLFQCFHREPPAVTTNNANDPNDARAHTGHQPKLPQHTSGGKAVGGFAFLSIVALVAFQWIDWLPIGASAPALLEPNFHDISKLDESDRSQIDRWLTEQVKRAKYPSLSVGIVRDGRIVYQNAIGLANIESGQHAATTTPYHVASVTKAFTASLAVILHDRGVVDLDAPVAKYLPDTVTISTQPQLGAKITLRQLASHTSGLPRGVPGRVQSVEGWYQLEPERLYKLLATVELEYEPGANDGYSNLGFGLLGHALERAAQQPFDELVQKLICEPLQLKNTRIQAYAPAATRHNPATGYSSSVPRRERTHSFRERLAPSGGLIASVDDLAAFLIAQMEAVNAQPNAGERPDSAFSKRALDQMHATVHLSDGSATHRALGWSIHQSSYIGRVLQKNGGRSNCSAWIGFSPEFRTGVVVVTNCGGPDVDPLGAWLLERLAPNAHHPVTKYGYAKVAPYSGMRWKGDRPIVQVDGKWLPLVSINEIPIDQIMTHAEKQFRSRARKRLAEDLVEVLSTMGQKVPWEATLGVEVDGEVKRIKKRMTENNRSMLRGP